jgi:hypothetical protein
MDVDLNSFIFFLLNSLNVYNCLISLFKSCSYTKRHMLGPIYYIFSIPEKSC